MSTIPNEWVEGIDYKLVDGMDLLKEWREGNEPTTAELEDEQMAGLIPMGGSYYGDRHTAASE